MSKPMGQPPQSTDASRVRWAAVSLALSGVMFVLFPVARPFFDGSSTQMAYAYHFASNVSPLAHSLAIVGFVFLALGILGLNASLKRTGTEGRSFKALVLYLIGSGLTLPFFGAEAFSLHVVGQAAIAQNNPALLSLVSSVRFGPGIVFVVAGLLLVAVSSVVLASAVWASRVLPKWSGIPFAVGWVFFMPLLQGAPVFQSIRIADALLIAGGSFWMARGMLRNANQLAPKSNDAIGTTEGSSPL